MIFLWLMIDLSIIGHHATKKVGFGGSPWGAGNSTIPEQVVPWNTRLESPIKLELPIKSLSEYQLQVHC